MNIVEFTKLKSTVSREIMITGKMTYINARQLDIYVQQKEVVEACKVGCPNYGKKWSCPPYAKDYLQLSKNYEYGILLCFSTAMKQYEDVKNKYLAIKAANATLKTLIEKVTRQIEDKVKGYSLLSGSCRLCKPCNCKVGKKCKRPKEMRYSMEATHLNVDKVVTMFLEHPLQWYGNKTLPSYTTTVTCILTNEALDDRQLNQILEECIEEIWR